MQLEDHSIKQNIPKLAVDGSNWVIFRDRLLWVLDTNSLSEHLAHDTIPASYTNAGPVGSLQPDERWRKEEGLVRQIIGATIPDTAFNRVKGCTNAKDIWTALKKIYEERTCSLMANMMRRLRNKRCGDLDNLRTHFEQLSDLHEQLAAMGKIIADDDYTDLLMSSLPLSYENVCTSINVSVHLNPLKLTPDALQLYMLDEYEVRMLKNNKETKDEAFTADSSKKKSKCDIECHNCHKRGHIKADCWAQGGGKEGQGPNRN